MDCNHVLEDSAECFFHLCHLRRVEGARGRRTLLLGSKLETNSSCCHSEPLKNPTCQPPMPSKRHDTHTHDTGWR